MTKRKLIDMFKNKIFPKQAEDLLKMNYEGLGELDKREFLRDTSILIMLAEKGLKTEQDIVKPYLEKLKEQIAKSADKQLKIAMGTADLNERYAHIRVESAFRQCIAMIDNLLSESDWNASYKGGQEDGKA